MPFTLPEQAACRKLITLALDEDLGAAGDITSQALIPPALPGRAVFVARAEGVVAGLQAAKIVCHTVDTHVNFQCEAIDGARLKRGDHLATVAGTMRSLLAAERTALNFLQHLSGVASLTAKYVEAIRGLPAVILDTRKTTPGWRLLEKYAVRCGGGHNHRLSLSDGILIKDNHLAALGNQLDLPAVVVATLKLTGRIPFVEVEVETLEQLKKVLPAKPQMVLLDNMTTDQLREAVSLRNQLAPGVLLEASGCVTLQTIRAIAETGVDRISVGALTHSAPALDIALDYQAT